MTPVNTECLSIWSHTFSVNLNNQLSASLPSIQWWKNGAIWVLRVLIIDSGKGYFYFFFFFFWPRLYVPMSSTIIWNRKMTKPMPEKCSVILDRIFEGRFFSEYNLLSYENTVIIHGRKVSPKSKYIVQMRRRNLGNALRNIATKPRIHAKKKTIFVLKENTGLTAHLIMLWFAALFRDSNFITHFSPTWTLANPSKPRKLRLPREELNMVAIDISYESPLISKETCTPFSSSSNWGFVTLFSGATKTYANLVCLSFSLVVMLRKLVFLGLLSLGYLLCWECTMLRPLCELLKRTRYLLPRKVIEPTISPCWFSFSSKGESLLWKNAPTYRIGLFGFVSIWSTTKRTPGLNRRRAR